MSEIHKAIKNAEAGRAGPAGNPEQRRRVLQALWLAFVSSLLVYGVVGARISLPAGTVASASLSSLRVLLAAMAAAAAVVSLWLRRKSTEDLLAGALGGPPPERALNAGDRLQASCIIVWALCEAVGIFGLVLCVLARSLDEYWPFGAAAAVLFYLHRPSAWPIDRILGGAGAPQ